MPFYLALCEDANLTTGELVSSSVGIELIAIARFFKNVLPVSYYL